MDGGGVNKMVKMAEGIKCTALSRYESYTITLYGLFATITLIKGRFSFFWCWKTSELARSSQFISGRICQVDVW